MKNIFTKTSLCCLLLFILSCAKDIEYIQPGGGKGGAAFFKAKVDGQTIEFKQATKAIYNVLDKKTIEILAFTESGKTMGFVIDDFKGPGKYLITETMLTTMSYIGDPQDFETFFISTGGQITITSYSDKLITGKFDFTGNNGERDIAISNGEFSIDLSALPIHDHLGDNKISAKLNGVLAGFKGQIIIGGTVLNISGMYGTKAITLSLRDFNGVGTYTLTPDLYFGNTLVYIPSADDAEFVCTSGTATVTSVDNKIFKGTFSGILENANGDRINITEGHFEVKGD